MPSLRDYWQGGFRALHIEENIGNAFADFAPYAGADEQRVFITRQASTTGASPNTASSSSIGTPLGPASYVSSSSAVMLEENGDFTIQARDANAGCITFSTTGSLQLDAAVRVPLPLPSYSSAPNMKPAESDTRLGPDDSTVLVTNAVGPSQRQSVNSHPAVKPSHSQLRFADFTRPVAPPRARVSDGDSAFAKEAFTAAYGQAEVDLSLPEWDTNRQSLGARLGPAAVRVTRTFSAAATATATEAATSQLQNSPLQSDEDEVLARTLLMESARKYQHTIDAAVCWPLGGGTRQASSERANDAATTARVTRTLRGDRIALRTAPWALTCGVQFPLDLGDTLVGLSVQNDRATSVVLPYPGVEWAVASPQQPRAEREAGDGEEEGAKDPASVACVPLALHGSSSAAPAAVGDGKTSVGDLDAELPSYAALPYMTFRFLLVQTVASHTLERGNSPATSPLRSDGGDTSLNTSGATRLASSYDWRRLPTLIGVNIGVDRERLRLSAASIVHDEAVDLEVAAALDMTPWTPRMPTLVKVGFNNVGRFAAGITSLFYETVTATLGVHMARGEQAKFGIEVKF